MKRDPLIELANWSLRELFIEFGLAEQHHLNQLAFLRLEIRQQSQGFKRLDWHGLRLVQKYNDFFAFSCKPQERVIDCLDQAMLVCIPVDLRAQFLCQSEQQAA